MGDLFSMVGLVSFLECGETSRTVSHHWPGEHEKSLLVQREKARAKCSKNVRYKKDEARSFVAQVDRLLVRAKRMIEGES